MSAVEQSMRPALRHELVLHTWHVPSAIFAPQLNYRDRQQQLHSVTVGQGRHLHGVDAVTGPPLPASLGTSSGVSRQDGCYHCETTQIMAFLRADLDNAAQSTHVLGVRLHAEMRRSAKNSRPLHHEAFYRSQKSSQAGRTRPLCLNQSGCSSPTSPQSPQPLSFKLRSPSLKSDIRFT